MRRPTPTSARARCRRCGCSGAGGSGAAGGRARGRRRRRRGSAPASHTVVSAPPSASRSNGPVTARKRGSDSCTPGVSAQPGWVASTWTPSAPTAAAARAAARPGRACCGRTPWSASSRPSRYSGSSARSRWPYMPPEVTNTTRRRRRPARVAAARSSAPGPSTCSAIVSLVALRRLGPLRRHRAGVVDQHVEPTDRGELARRSVVRRRGRPRRRRRRRSRARHRRLELAGPAAPLASSRTTSRTRRPAAPALGGGSAEPRGGAGDHGGPAGQRARRRVVGPGRQPAPDGRADAGEAQHDRAVQQRCRSRTRRSRVSSCSPR